MVSQSHLLPNYSSWRSNWSELRIAVVGLGKTGFSVADTLHELGGLVFAVAEKADAQTVDVLDVLGIRYLISESNESLTDALTEFKPDLAIVSPGIQPDNPVIHWLRDHNVAIWSDVDLAWRLKDKFSIEQQWICITGTNGKTTTAELTEAMLISAGVRAVACGNIGKPILDCIRDPANFEVLVVELSSFQLHYTSWIEPFSSVVLNLADDHLDWHGDFDRYKQAKGKIYRGTQVACVYNLADSNTQELVEQAEVRDGARAIGFSLGTPTPSNVGYVDDLLVDRAFLDERQTSALEIASLEDIASLGVLTPHLLANVAAATALARSFGVPPAAIKRALQEFRLSPHRIQLVGEIAGVKFINDSKATNAHAAEASIRSFEKVVWIVGGLLKGQDIGPLIQKLSEKFRGVVVIGEERLEILSALEQFAPQVPVREISESNPMEQAVEIALELAESGDTVLLAPAAASMDQFLDYADRGNQFAEAVERRISA